MGEDAAAALVHLGESVSDEARPETIGKLGERAGALLEEGERHCGRERPVGEHRIRGEQSGVHQITGESAQRGERLKRGDAPARHDDAHQTLLRGGLHRPEPYGLAAQSVHPHDPLAADADQPSMLDELEKSEAALEGLQIVSRSRTS